MSSAITIVGITAASAAAGAAAQAKAAKNAKQQGNRQLASDLMTRSENERMFLESRGAAGSAKYPTYFRRDNGDMFEAELAGDAMASYDSTAGLSAEDYRLIAERFRASQDEASRRGASLFDGGLEREQLANFEPVKNARVQFSRQATIDALNKTLANIEANQATKGYNGDSYGARRLKLDANSNAANQIAGFSLQNLMEERAIKDNILNLQMQNLEQPSRAAQSALLFESMPARSYIDMQNLRMSPMDRFNIGVQAHQYSPLNIPYSPSMSGTVLGGVSDIAGAVGGAMLRMPTKSANPSVPDSFYRPSNFSNAIDAQPVQPQQSFGSYPGGAGSANWMVKPQGVFGQY